VSELIDRLRTNLRIAGIAATDDDFAGIEARGFLKGVADFERVVAEVASDSLPDYLDAASLPPAVVPPLEGQPPTGALDTISGMAAQLRARQISPVELLDQALARIEDFDAQLNVFQFILADAARVAAQQAEREIAAGRHQGVLHGIPLAVKDLLDVAGLPTSAGSQVWADRIAEQDATSVARLRASGAVILGKTRMSEFAYSPGSNNAHFGSTANPYDLTRDSGGSSSGSGVAVVTGMAFAALGSDTGGSIRIPAALCGIVGLKPTHGRCSLSGAVTLAWSLDHLGPLTRSVADAALMLEALAGPDPRDGRTLRSAPGFSAGELTGEVPGLRAGVLRLPPTVQSQVSVEQHTAVQQAAAALQAAGAVVAEIDLPEMVDLQVVNGVILALEAANFHLPMLRTQLDGYGSFMRQRVLASFVYGPVALGQAQQARAQLRRRVSGQLAEVDVLLLPVQPDTAPVLGIPAPTTFTGPFNCLGWPAISLPVGLSGAGLPLAVQIVAHPWAEPTLLRAAYAAEQRLGRLEPPVLSAA
jgi:Asp-tRNA(Asn)/Glu-tRNA(Gln) amidotransferase A subunit family amidase